MSSNNAMTTAENGLPRHVIDFKFDTAGAAAILVNVRGLHPLLKRSASEHERIGKLTDEVVGALNSIGVFRMSTPRRWGGMRLPLRGRVDVVSEIARGCPSTGWVTVVFNISALGISVQRPEMQRRLLADGVSRICAPGPGGGTIAPSGDKWVVNGKWSIGSGLHHANWAMVPSTSPDGNLSYVALPMSEVRIARTWAMSGMKGTGSDTIIAKNVVVSSDCFTDWSKALGNDSYLYDEFLLEPTDYVATYPSFRTEMLAVLVGTVAGMLEMVVADKLRPHSGTIYQRKLDSSVYQARVGQAYSAVWAAQAILHQASHDIDRAAEGQVIMAASQRAENRGQVLAAVELLRSAVDNVMNLAGASGFADDNSIQRHWRDFCLASRHVVWNLETGYERIGQEVLEIENGITPPFLL
ncbi:acyl-CoA dehydrogenase family protein [Sphingobium mellinum]|uniref:acyl-CoA dehydrogenase family protein n=1 Tax=Sphingobium mellinum TaxID=1387166 RepID=UPI0030EBBD0C